MNKPIAIILGGTVPHKFLIENLKNRGYFTILVDYYDNPPAACVSDRHVKKSTLDKEVVLNLAKQENASLVISGCVDQANVTACYVAEKLGLPAPYSYEAALRVTDKALMKEGMLKAGVPTAIHEVVYIEQISDFQCDIFPKVIKPSDCNGSKGVRKVNNQAELATHLEEACKLSRTKKAIIEDFNQGIEVNGYFFVGEDDVKLLYTKSKMLPNTDGMKSLQSFLSIGPESLSDTARFNFLDATKKISTEFNLKNTPILVQANIDGDKVKVIEFAPRVGGGLAFREIKILTGFDLIDAVIDSYLGVEVKVNLSQYKNDFVSVLHLYGTHGTFDRVEGLEELVEGGVIKEYFIHKTPGMLMNSEDLASRNRVLGIILFADSNHALFDKIKTIYKCVKIQNSNNENVVLAQSS